MNQDDTNSMSKPLPEETIRREHIVQGIAQSFGVDYSDNRRPKKQRSPYEQQRLINQAKERREKRYLKRAKIAERNNRMG